MNIHTVYTQILCTFTFDSDLPKCIQLTKLFSFQPNINYLPNIIWLNRIFNYSVATLQVYIHFLVVHYTMASADSVGEESFHSQVGRVRSEIHTKFIRAHGLLQDREADLLAELQRLVDEYTGEGITQQISDCRFRKMV